MMIVLVCGGRAFKDYMIVARTLNSLNDQHAFTKLIHGGAPGADTMAARWAEIHGVYRQVFYARWDLHGRAAGPIRNKRMLDEGNPNLVVAFPGGSGTADMIKQTRAAGVELFQVIVEPERPPLPGEEL
jgi:predicted Rossmann-fold nucleotide-binding protein